MRKRITQKHSPKEKLRKLRISLTIIKALHMKHLFLRLERYLRRRQSSVRHWEATASALCLLFLHPQPASRPFCGARALLSCALTSLIISEVLLHCQLGCVEEVSGARKDSRRKFQGHCLILGWKSHSFLYSYY